MPVLSIVNFQWNDTSKFLHDTLSFWTEMKICLIEWSYCVTIEIFSEEKSVSKHLHVFLKCHEYIYVDYLWIYNREVFGEKISKLNI